MRVLILAGYETTSISLTWALVELSQNPSTQEKLRKELLDTYPNSDIPYDVLSSPDALPYLDAVTREVLRLHPPLSEVTREAAEDDEVLEFNAPARLPKGARCVNSCAGVCRVEDDGMR